MHQNREIEKNWIWLQVAKKISELSTCQFTKVGCVLLTDSYELISTGYNGTISKAKHCCDEVMTREEHSLFADKNEIHAEMNAILQAIGTSKEIKGSICFTSLQPCYNCLKHLCRIGVSKVYYAEDYWRNNQEEYAAFVAETFPMVTVEKLEEMKKKLPNLNNFVAKHAPTTGAGVHDKSTKAKRSADKRELEEELDSYDTEKSDKQEHDAP